MALDLSNSAIDRVRLRLGDTTCPYILDDQTIDYYITKNANNENQAYKELLTVMLFSLSRLWVYELPLTMVVTQSEVSKIISMLRK